jgi:mono/diheme cytochrome c family protein
MKKKTIMLFLITGLAASAFTFKTNDDKKPWPVPDAAKNKKNPVASNAASIAAGKELWSTHCKSCHGAKGLGDGNKAAQLKTEPGDFSKADTQSQTEGSLFYKIAEGRDDMPGFKKKIPDEDDRWNLVVFTRTLKK